MRTLIRVGALSAIASAALLVAPAAHAAGPGDNGTVKIHEVTTAEDLPRNEPHVCTFYLDAFGFDGGQQVTWHIDTLPPTAKTKGETVESGAITLDDQGNGRTEDLSLADGHYKLYWDFDGKHGAPKHKAFWTDCENGEVSAPGNTVESPSPTPSATTAASPAASPTDGATSSAAATAPSSTPSAQGSTSDLAETGSGAPVGLLSGVAAAFLAVGAYLVVRRRKAASQG